MHLHGPGACLRRPAPRFPPLDAFCLKADRRVRRHACRSCSGPGRAALLATRHVLHLMSLCEGGARCVACGRPRARRWRWWTPSWRAPPRSARRPQASPSAGRPVRARARGAGCCKPWRHRSRSNRLCCGWPSAGRPAWATRHGQAHGSKRRQLRSHRRRLACGRLCCSRACPASVHSWGPAGELMRNVARACCAVSLAAVHGGARGVFALACCHKRHAGPGLR